MFYFYLIPFLLLIDCSYPSRNNCAKEFISPDEVCGDNEDIAKYTHDYFAEIRRDTNHHVCESSSHLIKIDGRSDICPFESLNMKKVRGLAIKLRTEHQLPLICKNDETSVQLGIGFVITRAGFPHKALDHYENLLQENSRTPCAAIYFSRAQVYQRLGSEYAANALSDYTEALAVATTVESLQIYEARGNLFFVLNQKELAYRDYTEAINILPSSLLYYQRALTLYYTKKYHQSYDDLKKSNDIRPNDPNVIHTKALCLQKMNRLEETYQLLKQLLTYKTDDEKLVILIAISNVKRDLNDLNGSLFYINKALKIKPNSTNVLQLKSKLLYEHGFVERSLKVIQEIKLLEPTSRWVQMMEMTNLVDMGNYFEGIKLITKLADKLPVTRHGWSVYPKIFYLREWCRFLHNHLDIETRSFSALNQMTPSFVHHWVLMKNFHIKNYTEQPSIEPRIRFHQLHISEDQSHQIDHFRAVSRLPWDQLPQFKRRLLCDAYFIGSRIYSQGGKSNSSSINRRLMIASGLASLEIAQLISELWNSKASQKIKSKTLSWRKPFDVAMKWMRFIESLVPIFWNDEIWVEERDFFHNILVIQENSTNFRFSSYLPSYYKMYMDNQKVRPQLKKVKINSTNDIESFYKIYEHHSFCSVESKSIKSINDCPSDNRFAVTSKKINSRKRKDEKYIRGVQLSITSNRERKMSLQLALNYDSSTIQDYNTELDYLWKKMDEEQKKTSQPLASASISTVDPFVNLLISFMFYFYNLMPISHSGAEVAYSTFIGFILGIGREATGAAPRGKELFLDAVTLSDSEKFRSYIRSWLNIKSSRKVQNLVMNSSTQVADLFPTYRSMLETLLYDLEYLCK